LVRKEGLGRVQESLPDPMHTLPMDPAARTARDDPPPAARYDAVADFYQTGWPDTYTDPASVALFELLGPPADERVLDLACGHGRISRELARRGARVVGVDLSTALLDRARARDADEPLPISYVHGDAASRSLLDGEVFDAVVCSFGLSDIDDLDGAIATVARLLAPGGRFVFSLLHPCFAGGQDVSGSWPSWGSYHDEGWWVADGALSSLRRQVGANHRRLSTYLNTLRGHGLVIDWLAEPRPPEDWRERRLDVARFPVFLVARAARL
jgi:SAM-dependent methyltransferase